MRNISDDHSQKLAYPINIQKNNKEFSAILTSGDSSIIQDEGSKISIGVEKGTRAVIMQHIHSNLEALGYTTSNNECIVSPVVTVYTLEINQQNLISNQGDELMIIKKDDGHVIDLQPMSHVKPKKSENQPIKPEPSSSEDTRFSITQSMKLEALSPEDAQDSVNDLPIKHEPLSTDKEKDDQSIKYESSPHEEATISVKLEPLSPEQASISDDDQSMKSEPLSHEKAEDSENDYSKNLEYLSAEKARSGGDQRIKLELEEDRQSKEYPVSSEGSRDLDHQPIKPKAKSFHSTEDYNDTDKAQYSVVQAAIGGPQSTDMYPEPLKYFVPQNLEERSLYNFKLTIPHYVEQDVLVPLIQVKWGNIYEKLWEIRKGKYKDKFEPYCEVYNDHVVVYADHFCDVVCTLPEKVCASKLFAFPFGQIESEPGRKKTHAKVKTYLCNHLYQDESLRKVRTFYHHIYTQTFKVFFPFSFLYIYLSFCYAVHLEVTEKGR